jgi:hypothetical protein
LSLSFRKKNGQEVKKSPYLTKNLHGTSSWCSQTSVQRPPVSKDWPKSRPTKINTTFMEQLPNSEQPLNISNFLRVTFVVVVLTGFF